MPVFQRDVPTGIPQVWRNQDQGRISPPVGRSRLFLRLQQVKTVPSASIGSSLAFSCSSSWRYELSPSGFDASGWARFAGQINNNVHDVTLRHPLRRFRALILLSATSCPVYTVFDPPIVIVVRCLGLSARQKWT